MGRSRLLIAAAALVVACADPTDVLFTPTLITPVEVTPGLFRVTFDVGPDQVRGFTPTGDTILFRAFRGTSSGPAWEILGIPAAGGLGPVERAGIYRTALRVSLGALSSRAQDRMLTWWLPGNSSDFFGPAGCPDERQLTVWTVGMLRLPPDDGVALSSVPDRQFVTPTVTGRYRVRFTPAEVEAEQGADPFGPALAPTATLGFYSDGDSTWRFDPASAATPAALEGPGTFPAVSPDDALLAVAVPQVVDSTTVSETVTSGLASCTQDEISYVVAQWTTVVRRLATGDTVAAIDGREPVFDPAGGRILVRRPTGLVWVDLASKAETSVANTAGAVGVAVSPDGAYIAFSKAVGQNTDVYLVKQ